MNAEKLHSQRAQTQSRSARKLKPIVLSDLAGRLAFSPREAGAVVGKSPTYIYRQFYAGRLKPISDCGRMMISRAELDRFLGRAADYNPKPKSNVEPNSRRDTMKRSTGRQAGV